VLLWKQVIKKWVHIFFTLYRNVFFKYIFEKLHLLKRFLSLFMLENFHGWKIWIGLFSISKFRKVYENVYIFCLFMKVSTFLKAYTHLKSFDEGLDLLKELISESIQMYVTHPCLLVNWVSYPIDIDTRRHRSLAQRVEYKRRHRSLAQRVEYKRSRSKC